MRLKSPATEQEAIANAMRVLETQMAQVDGQIAAQKLLSADDRAALARARGQLEELVRTLATKVQDTAMLQDRTAVLSQQMDNLNRQRESLVRQQQELQRQIARTNESLERMKVELRQAQEASKKR